MKGVVSSNTLHSCKRIRDNYMSDDKGTENTQCVDFFGKGLS